RWWRFVRRRRWWRGRGGMVSAAVVFLHGFLGAADDWDVIIHALAGEYPCVASELPGHGANLHHPDAQTYTLTGAAANVQRKLDARGVSSGVLVGYSLGGRVALAMVAAAPTRWRGLVLESVTPGLITAADRAQRVAADEGWALRFEQEPLAEVLRDWYAQPVFAPHPPDADLLARRCRNDPVELAKVLRGMGQGVHDLLDGVLARWPHPLLLLAGEHDAKFQSNVERMRHLCPRATRAIVSKAGHNAHVEQPDAFLRHMRGFLNTLM
ncbi:MAG: 2-succinyl-6-hydroxy-2,4-cyclohexadiene-1-carboxylate synthase, partial [Verrucomicrobia bacterium]|nr:2-succinyl-6-hydroxy-2,4-cyclohexadiene-1-carboxylate synthase [Verrucomicrobiota bacterium]